MPGKTSFDRHCAFVITKPLQLMIAMLIVRQSDWGHRPTFIITNSFTDALTVTTRLSDTYSDECECVFVEEIPEAYAYIRRRNFSNIFIDSDVGFRKHIILLRLKLLRRPIKINVYEEGLGTYRDDMYSGLRRFFLKTLAVATHFGAYPLTNHIFVFNPAEYARKFPEHAQKVREIGTHLWDFVQSDMAKLDEVFMGQNDLAPQKTNDLCLLYLTSWSIDPDFIRRFQSMPGDHYIKYHPHISPDTCFNNISKIQSGAPAELVIAHLLEIYEHVQVFDHNSSVRRYIRSNRVSFEMVT